jgi:hypothetical protein
VAQTAVTIPVSRRLPATVEPSRPAQPQRSSSPRLTATTGNPPDTTLAGWTLVWSDVNSAPWLPDATKWDYDTDRNKVGCLAGELQYSRPRPPIDNAKAGWPLVITARRENPTSATDRGQNYTFGAYGHASAPCSGPGFSLKSAPSYYAERHGCNDVGGLRSMARGR